MKSKCSRLAGVQVIRLRLVEGHLVQISVRAQRRMADSCELTWREGLREVSNEHAADSYGAEEHADVRNIYARAPI